MNDPILEAPVEEHLRASMPAGEADRMWRSFKLHQRGRAELRARRRRGVALAMASGLGLAAAAALGLVYLVPDDAPGPVALAEGHALPGALGSLEDPSVYDLDDGSRILLAPHTEAQIVANDDAEVRTRIDHGGVTFDVHPHGPRRWIVDAGDARVEVLGTRFTVIRRGAGALVRVERGRVEVHHPSLDRVAVLTAGQSLEVGERGPAHDPTAEAARAARSPAPAEPAPAPASPSAAWRARAERGDFEGAYRLLGPRGLRARARAAGPAELMLLADVARRAGHPEEAMAVYTRLVSRAPADVRAPVAAFSLGRLQLAGAPADAADSFAFVRGHDAGAALREDATALEARARARAGQGARARALAREYLERFPAGRRAGSMRELAGTR